MNALNPFVNSIYAETFLEFRQLGIEVRLGGHEGMCMAFEFVPDRIVVFLSDRYVMID